MKTSDKALTRGKVNSRLVDGVDGYPQAVAVAGYIPNGYDNSTRRSIKERHALGCTQVVVSPGHAGGWQCTEIVSGAAITYPSNVDPQWAAEMAAADFADEWS